MNEYLYQRSAFLVVCNRGDGFPSGGQCPRYREEGDGRAGVTKCVTKRGPTKTRVLEKVVNYVDTYIHGIAA
jgi:hypothetical protein